jgi:hypothetical protein
MAETQAKPGSNGEGTGVDEPQYVTEEQLNKAITGRLKSFEKKLDDSLKSINEAYKAQLETLSTTTQQTAPKEPKSTTGESPEFAGMKKRFAELEARSKKLEEERDAERNSAKDSKLRQKLGEELSTYGIPANAIRHAVGFLTDADRRVSYDDNGDIVFKDSDGTQVDLTTGLRSWVQTEDAKLYLPARGSSGTGGRQTKGAPATRKAAKGTEPTESLSAQREELGEALFGFLYGQ